MIVRAGLIAAACCFVMLVGCAVPPPATPEAPAGAESGLPGVSYQFDAVTSDPLGLLLQYRFSWGDGQTSDWGPLIPNGTVFSSTHSWQSAGMYEVRAQARNISGRESEFSVPHSVAIGRNSTYPDSVTAVISDVLDPVDLAADPVRHRVYVIERGRDRLLAINTQSNTVAGHVNVGTYPHAVCVLPSGEYAYVADAMDNKVYVVRLSDLTVTGSISVGNFPISLTSLPDGRYVYVSNYHSGTVSVIRTSDNSIVATVPIEVYVWTPRATPDGRYVYVAGSNTRNLYVIETATNTVTRVLQCAPGVSAIAMLPNGQYAYVPCHRDTVNVVRLSDQTVVAAIPISGYPTAAVALPNSEYVYVATATGAEIVVIRTSDNAVVWRTGGASYATFPDVTPDGEAVYVPVEYNNAVWVVGQRR